MNVILKDKVDENKTKIIELKYEINSSKKRQKQRKFIEEIKQLIMKRLIRIMQRQKRLKLLY